MLGTIVAGGLNLHGFSYRDPDKFEPLLLLFMPLIDYRSKTSSIVPTLEYMAEETQNGECDKDYHES